MAKIRFNINGTEVSGYAGQTVLDIARETGIDIPTLCYDDRVAIYGACGLCIVEMEGTPKLLRACATVISEGMIINTNTDKVKESRRTALELLLSDHSGDCRPPCSLGCPAGTDCQGYIGMVANGEYNEAAKIIKETFPLASSIGRVCPHPCETACRREMVEEPISIAFIKSFIGDRDLASEKPYTPEVEKATGHTVAIIGGGPAGLTAAYQLRRKGHDVTIFDAMPEMGGMLRYGIPEYRLPKAILQQEVDVIASMGVKMLNNIKIGKDLIFKSITDTYDAVLLAVGAWSSIQMGVTGEENENVHGGIDFLRKVALNEDVIVGEYVAIVGGGNTAMDACRTAVRLGAKKVYCVYRRTKAEMPAEDIEIKEAEEEGVIFKYLTNPIEIVTGENGSIRTVRLQQMELGEADASGRRSPVAIEGATKDLKVNALIMALGQKLDAKGLEGVELTRRGTISADENTFRTNMDNVFAVGDATNQGAGIAITAIGEADKAARVIDSFLKGAVVAYKKPFVVERHDLTPEDFADRKKTARQNMRHTSPKARNDNFHEVNRGFSEEEAVKEASRCLECGCHDFFECKLIDYANQIDIAPEKYTGVVHNRKVDNSHPFIDRNPDKCVLCGLCVRVCDEVMGRTALGLVDRGFDTIVKPALDLPLVKTDCISCGQCISLCPTGALGEKLSIKKSVPVSTISTNTMCSFCSVGCKTTLNTKGKLIIKSVPDGDNALLCVKGRFGFGELTKTDRLTTPLISKEGVLTPVTWEEANLFIAKKMQSTIVRGGKSAVSISDKLTNEEIYLAKKYATDVARSKVFSFGAMESGLKTVLGIDGSTNKMEELLSTNLIILVATDMMKEHATLGARIRQAKQNGTKVVVISDLEHTHEASEWADVFVLAEDNMATLKGIIKSQIDMGAKATDELIASVSSVSVSDEAKTIAKMYMEAKKAMIVFDEAKITTNAAVALADMAVLAGRIGTPRNGIIQIKPNSNSQGLSELEIGVADIKDVKAMMIFGEDVVGFDRKNLEFLAVADMYLTETAKKADVVLPLVSLVESNGTITSCDTTVNTVTTAIPAFSKSNIEVIQGIANAMTANFNYNSANEVAREMAEKKSAKTIAVNLAPVLDGKLFANVKNTNVVFNNFNQFLEEAGI